MAPIDALTLTGTRPRVGLQPRRHPVHPAPAPRERTLPARREHPLVTVASSRSLGFVGADGIGSELLSATSLFRACRRPRTAI
jgi:hypothetical protein